jgi:acyl carrier protein
MAEELTGKVSKDVPMYVLSAIETAFGMDASAVTRDTLMVDVCTESIDYVDFSFRLEQSVGVDLVKSTLADLVTVGDVADYVEKVVKKRRGCR